MRQDAVMTQVFRYVNELMMRRDHSSRRGSRSGQHVLQMVTYNVSPLSPRSGVSLGCSDFCFPTSSHAKHSCDRRCWNGSKTPFRLEYTGKIKESQEAAKTLPPTLSFIQASGEIPFVASISLNHLPSS